MFLLVDDASIPPTNNSSEQAIHMSTVFRKGTNGFYSEWGRDLLAAVRSVVHTGKQKGLSAYQVLEKALSPFSSLFELAGVVNFFTLDSSDQSSSGRGRRGTPLALLNDHTAEGLPAMTQHPTVCAGASVPQGFLCW